MQAESHIKVLDLAQSGRIQRTPWIPEQWMSQLFCLMFHEKKIKDCLLKVSFMCTLLPEHHFPLSV